MKSANCPMKKKATEIIPKPTFGLRRIPRAEPFRLALSAGIDGSVRNCPASANAASGTTEKNAPLQPMY